MKSAITPPLPSVLWQYCPSVSFLNMAPGPALGLCTAFPSARFTLPHSHPLSKHLLTHPVPAGKFSLLVALSLTLVDNLGAFV